MKGLMDGLSIIKLTVILLLIFDFCAADDYNGADFNDSVLAPNNKDNATAEEEEIRGLMLNLPLSFVENQGQASPEIVYMTKTPKETVYFTSSEAVFVISSGNNSSAVNMTFEGASPQDIIAQDPLSGKVNFLLGNDSTKWVTDLPTYTAIRYDDLYPGIDLVFKGTEGILKHEFLVEPGADPSQIVLAYDGQDNLSLDDNGSLVITTPTGNLTDSRPVIYQNIDGKKTAVEGKYRLFDNSHAGFEIGQYDRSYSLVIDPVLKYSTYLGGTISSTDAGQGIAVDGSGNAYVTGFTTSANFPLQSSFQGSYAGSDAFVTKFNAAGNALAYSTYLGGNGIDIGTDISVDGSGNAYVTGFTTSANFPLQNPFQGYTGSQDAFVTKLNAAGNTLGYSTYLGGAGIEIGYSIDVGSSGNAYVTGSTTSPNFPLQLPLQGFTGTQDAFVTKFNPAGNTLAYSTYLGGASTDAGMGIAIDGTGNAYVTGSTTSPNFPLINSVQGFTGTQDVFVAKFNPAGNTLAYSTYLGGSGSDLGYGIAVAGSGNAYVTGYTTSTNFPLLNPFQGSNAGGQDAFVTKFNAAGNTLAYSTYLGGTGTDLGYGIAIDGSGNAYVAGLTTSSNFPLQSPFQGSNAGGQDAFVTKLNAAGNTLAYSTYLGGTGIDDIRGVALDSSANAYMTGSTTSSNFPLQSPFQSSYTGSLDAFVTKLNAAGNTLGYSTYLGGTGPSTDIGNGIAVDGSGNAYVTGSTTSTIFPLQSPFQGSFAGIQDAFVTKFNAAGNTLAYSTYLGGASSDQGRGIAVDNSGNAYVTGYTQSSNFPLQSPFQGSYAGSQDAFVTKLNAAGNTMAYSTYLGGNSQESGLDIAVDGSGNAYVTGDTTSPNFPLLNPFQGGFAGSQDAFVTKFNAAGNTLGYSTYLGGNNLDDGMGIAVDSSGNAYITGYTQSSNFPLQSPFQGFTGSIDAFVTKLNAAGNAPAYSTYLGGNAVDYGNSIAVDGSGNAYVVGTTYSPNFPVQNAYQATKPGGVSADVYLTKFNPAGNTLAYSTYLGGAGTDDGLGIAVDGNSNAYVTGYTQSSNFPILNPFQVSLSGSQDVFVTRFNAVGNFLSYSTYLGGNNLDNGQDIAVDGSGNAYVTGYTQSSSFPLQSPFQASYTGGQDAFVSVLATTTCISGYKLNEQEDGLAGWTIYADSDNNGQFDWGEKNATTNASGYWQICGMLPGSYAVCEVLQSGWTRLDPVGCRSITISDPPLSISNINFTNSKLACLSGYKIDRCTSLPLSGWNITVSNATRQWTTTTNVTGFWRICQLKNDTYTVCEVLNPGWTQTSLPVCHPVTLAGVNITNINFTNQKLYCISGYKLDNCTGAPIPGWNITLENATKTVSQLTGPDGKYEFCNLKPGDYNLTEEVKPGYNAVTVVSNPVSLSCANLTYRNFTNQRLYCMSGYKLDNCTKMGIAGWSVTINNSTFSTSVSTDTGGRYEFCNLMPGVYTLTEETRSGYVSKSPVKISATLPCSYNLTNQNFTNLKLLCIGGRKTNACNGAGLSGWQMILSNSSGQVATTTTNAAGYYQFCGLAPGQYKVQENLQPGWQNLTNLSINITLGCVNLSNVSFVNKPAQCTQSLDDDLNVTKVAQVNGISVHQVDPGQIFNYNITVINKDLINDTPLVLVTDKLPYEVEYLGAEVYPAAPQDYSINQSGDLIYVRFDQIASGSTRYINITVKAPSQAPTTLFNMVNLRYRDDQNQSDNSMTLTIYVPQLGYNQTEAAKSFEDLLHNQSQLLFQFEDLLHTVPSTLEDNYTFIASFEQLLRSQADLTSSFEDLLSNQSSTGWDTEYTEENRTYLLQSYEQMLWDQAFLFASFNAKLNDSWMGFCGYSMPGHTQDAQFEFMASFEDLLKRQTRLYKSFNLLLKKIDISSSQDLIDFLAAYENLLRVEANLLMSFNELLDSKCSYSRVCSQECEYSSIQAAVDAASQGDLIIIAEGTYNERLHINKSLTIEGAGAGKTVIDGDLMGSVFTFGSSADRNFDVRLSGMTIREGSGTIDIVGNSHGGGIMNYGTLSIDNSEITGNVLAGMGSGGGIANNGGDFKMVNCKIWGNHASADGAGMNNGGIAVLENCEFYDNHAGWSSGAINNGGQLTIINCYLHDNTARIYGGAIDNTDGGKLTLINSRITNNRNSGWRGGGVSNHEAGSTVTGDPAQVYGNTPNDRWGW